jgi:hypothetical protein
MKYWAATGHRIPGNGLIKLGLVFHGKYTYIGHAAIAKEGFSVHFLMMGGRLPSS